MFHTIQQTQVEKLLETLRSTLSYKKLFDEKGAHFAFLCSLLISVFTSLRTINRRV